MEMDGHFNSWKVEKMIRFGTNMLILQNKIGQYYGRVINMGTMRPWFIEKQENQARLGVTYLQSQHQAGRSRRIPANWRPAWPT